MPTEYKIERTDELKWQVEPANIERRRWNRRRTMDGTNLGELGKMKKNLFFFCILFLSTIVKAQFTFIVLQLSIVKLWMRIVLK